MKRSIIATALCGVLMSPIINAVDMDKTSVADYWSLAQEACEKNEAKKDRMECNSWIHDRKEIWSRKRTKREIVKMTIEVKKRYWCTDDYLPIYNISRKMCHKIIMDNAPSCEKEFLPLPELPETAMNIHKLLRFQMCLSPALSCSAENMEEDKALQKRCRDLELDAKG